MEAAKELLRLMDDSTIKTITTLGEGSFSVFELTANSGIAIGSKLNDIDFPKDAFIAAIQRDTLVFCPKANDCVFENDILIVIGPENIESKLMELYGKK